MHQFQLRAVQGEFFVSVKPGGQAPQGDAAIVARRFVSEVRFGVETNDSIVLELAQRLERVLEGERFSFREVDASLGSRAFKVAIATRIEREVRLGRLVVELRLPSALTERPDLDIPNLPPLPSERQSSTMSFEVRFVDEVGKAINGLPVELQIGDDVQDLTTNPAGLASVDDVAPASASISAADAGAVEKILDERWTKARNGNPPKEGNTTTVTFAGLPVGPVPVKAAVPNTVVIQPPLGRLFVQLFDKSGKVRHANRDYSIDGPAPLSGTTDALGTLLHDDVFPGDYTLTLTVEFFDGDAEESDDYTSPLVVLDAGEANATERQLGVVPYSVLARLHFFFNTNKAFLLPTALPGIRLLQKLYFENNPSKLLVVGHADTAGGSSVNDPLSLARAKATVAFLKDDIDAWLDLYGDSQPQKQRWGGPEDRMMLVSMPDFGMKPKGQDGVRWFQETRGLTVDGKAGPETRRQLVTEYMALDGTSLTAPGLDIEATAHGCGENFPLDADGDIDPAPQDDKPDASNRRVELFFFEPEFGIVPPPPGANSAPGSTEYPLWRESVVETHDITPGEFDGPQVIFLEVLDAHFRTDSAVVLPQAETPTGDEGGVSKIAAASIFATALRYDADHPGKRVFVAGHTDTTGAIDFNQKLSDERAQCVLALLVGGADQRETFASLCDGRHTVADVKEILAWVAENFDDLGFSCDPKSIDDNATTAAPAVKSFQESYNENLSTLRPDDPTAEELDPDGVVGPLTWSAFFDCYELALARELGETTSGVADLRAKLTFVDDDRRALGFSEYFPVEELGVDNFKSQANRRAEILFFDGGEEPDLAASEDDPETSELYLPGNYERVPLGAMPSTKPWRATWDAPTVSAGETRTMQLAAPGLSVGTPLTWTLTDASGLELAEFASVATADGGSFSVSDWVFPDTLVDLVALDAGDAFNPSEFSFSVEGGERDAASEDPVTYADMLKKRLTVTVSFDEDVFPDALPYVLHTLAGSRRGKTQTIDGEDGWVLETGLPPGGATLVVEDIEAVGTAGAVS